MKVPDLIHILAERGACDSSRYWLATFPPEAPAYLAWRNCPRADWLAWLVDEEDVAEALSTEYLGNAALDILEAQLPEWDRWCTKYNYPRPSVVRRALKVARAQVRGAKQPRQVTDAREGLHNAYSAVSRTCWSSDDPFFCANVRSLVADLEWALDCGEGAQAFVVAANTPRKIRQYVKWSDVRKALEKGQNP